MALHPKFKLGLGIGCGVLMVAFLLLFGGAVYFAKQMGKEYKQVKELEQELVRSLGPSNQLAAGLTGWPDAERLDRFVAVREGTAEWRRQVEIDFAALLAEEGPFEKKGLRQFIRAFRASRDLAPVFSGFWTARNQTMLDQQLGMAEYIYLYCLVYYSWLGHEPADGARDTGGFLAGMGATGPMPEAGGDSLEAQDQDREHRQRWARSQVNRLMRPLLQQAARQAAESEDPATLIWAEALRQELRAVQDDSLRLPFAGTLPAETAAALEPLRLSLEATYSVAVNPIELIFEDTWQEP